MKVNIGKNIWTCIMVMLAGIVGGVALLVMAFLIPVSEEQAKKSLDIIVAEDSYPALPIVGDFSGMNFQGFAPGVLDNSSDRIMLFTALDMAKADQGALVRSMRMYNGYMGKDYAYYWHGYVSILRPLLGIIAYDDLRFLNGLLQLLLMFGLTGMVWRKRGKVYGAVMLTSYVLLMPVALMFSLQYTWVFYIAMLSTLLLVRRARWAAENQRYIPVFLAIGMLTSYFDLLTYPLVTWGIPLLWWMMMREPAEKGSDRILETVLSGISWVLGYGLFWAVKWCLGTLVLRQDVFQMALDEIFTRSGVEEKLSLAERFGAAYINWKHYGYFIYAVILGAWLFWGLARYLRKGWAVQNNVFACLLAGASSMVWYLVLANHTLIHHIFTYRIHSVGILAFLAIWAGAFDGGGHGGPICAWEQAGEAAGDIAHRGMFCRRRVSGKGRNLGHQRVCGLAQGPALGPGCAERGVSAHLFQNQGLWNLCGDRPGVGNDRNYGARRGENGLPGNRFPGKLGGGSLSLYSGRMEIYKRKRVYYADAAAGQ